ncbi:MAG: serine protease [Verrucomicrobiales bacterium]|nr:serine protease [Verrucomicrobiales bacterium]
MKRWVTGWILLGWALLGVAAPVDTTLAAPERVVYVVPIRDDIMPPMTYVVRRGVKEAMEAKADLLVVDMDTNGGRVDVTEEIIGILGKFPGETLTYVNRKAFSAGAFIAVGTQRIFMAEEAVIGAAAPMLMVPGGGPAQLPETVEAKMTSGIKALIRAKAEKNGHNVEVMEAMIDRNKELVIGEKVINPKGQILTLTSSEASKEYGSPPKPLLSAGTYASLDALLDGIGYGGARKVEVRPTGVEQVAFWLNAISPLLLAIGLIGVYMEFKTPGFGVPGMIAIGALLLYFAGGYIAGLSGIEWVAVFVLGAILIALELFLFPGTLALGLAGSLLVLVSILMAAVDLYPGMPVVPSLPTLEIPIRNLGIAALLTVGGVWALGLILPRTPAYHALVSQATSGGVTDTVRERERHVQVGKEGVTVSVLRPGGKARFGEEILDVIAEGGMIDKGKRVRIVGHSAREARVEACEG